MTTNKNTLQAPEIGALAYDADGNQWEILDYVRLDANAMSIKRFLSKYDSSGIFNDFIDYDEDYIAGRLAVAAENEYSETAVWMWGFDGIYYE